MSRVAEAKAPIVRRRWVGWLSIRRKREVPYACSEEEGISDKKLTMFERI